MACYLVSHLECLMAGHLGSMKVVNSGLQKVRWMAGRKVDCLVDLRVLRSGWTRAGCSMKAQ